MSADVTYKVEIELLTKGSLTDKLAHVSGHAERLDGLLHTVSSTASSMAGAIGGAFEGAADRAAGLVATLAKVTAVGAGGALAYGVMQLNNELEKTQIALATIFSVNGLTKNVEDGMGVAAATMADLRRDAAALPGEFKDLRNIFSTIALPGFHAGASISELRDFSAKSMAAAQVAQVPMEQAAREIAMLLEGRAGAHNVFGMKLFGLGGQSAEAFNRKSAEDRFRYLRTEIERYGQSIELYKSSFDGLSSTFIDNAKMFLTAASGPLFDRIKAALTEANTFWDKHEDKILHFAATIGDKLGKAFDWAWEKAKKLEPLFEKLADELTSDQLGTHLAVGALGVAALGIVPRVAGGIGSAAGSAAGSLGGAAITALTGGLGGLAGAAAGTSGGGLGSILEEGTKIQVTTEAFLAMLPAVVAAAGAVHVMTDESSQFHARATKLWDDIVDKGETAFSKLSDSSSGAMSSIEALADRLGVGLLVVLDKAAGVALKAANAIDHFSNRVGMLLDLMNLPIGTASTAKGGVAPAVAKAIAAFTANLGKTPPSTDLRAKSRAGAGGGGGGTRIERVEITVTTNADPSRIARLVYADLANLARHRRTSPDVRNFSASRP